MKFSADRNQLCDAVTNAGKAAAYNSTIPALEGVLLNLKGETLTVTGYDLEMGIKNMIKVIDSKEEGEIVLNSKLLVEILRKLPSGTPVEITTEEDTKVNISCGKIKYNLVGVSGMNYPNIPEISLATSFTIKENVLKSMIRQTIYAVSTNDVRPILGGSLFEIVDNQLRVVCLDGTRVARKISPVSYKDLSFVAPSKTLNELLRILSDEETEKDITITVTDHQLGFYRDDYMIISRLLEGKYLDYERFISFTPTMEAVVNAREMASSLDRTLLLTEKYKSPVICEFENDSLHISCNTNLGSLDEIIPIKYGYSKLTIGFNGRFMMEALKYSECDQVKLQFTSPIAPIKIVPMEGEDFTFLVLPVKIK